MERFMFTFYKLSKLLLRATEKAIEGRNPTSSLREDRHEKEDATFFEFQTACEKISRGRYETVNLSFLKVHPTAGF